MITLSVGLIGTDDALQTIFGNDIRDGWINNYNDFKLYVTVLRVGQNVHIPKDLDMLVLCDNVSFFIYIIYFLSCLIYVDHVYLSASNKAMLFTEARFVSVMNTMQQYFEKQNRGIFYNL